MWNVLPLSSASPPTDVHTAVPFMQTCSAVANLRAAAASVVCMSKVANADNETNRLPMRWHIEGLRSRP
jgi:hypothetical protein